MRYNTQWQTIHVPEQIIDKWRILACDNGTKVSDFDLFASWIHLVGASNHLYSFLPLAN